MFLPHPKKAIIIRLIYIYLFTVTTVKKIDFHIIFIYVLYFFEFQHITQTLTLKK